MLTLFLLSVRVNLLQECKENYPFLIQLFLHKHDAERSLLRHRWGKGKKYFPFSLYILKNVEEEGIKRIFCTAFAFYYALLTIYLQQLFKLFTQLTKYWDGTFSSEFYKQGGTTLLAISGCSSSDLRKHIHFLTFYETYLVDL